MNNLLSTAYTILILVFLLVLTACPSTKPPLEPPLDPITLCNNLMKDSLEIGVDCGGPCKPCNIRVEKELVIKNLNVVNSQEAINGRLSFRHLITTLAGESDPSELVLSLLNNWRSNFKFSDNSTALARRQGIEQFMTKWIKVDGHTEGLETWSPKLANAPFRLLAITNRLDLHSLDEGSGGEGRFSFCALDPETREPLTWTFIFEYNLNAQTNEDCTNWAITWHSLSDSDINDNTYLDRLVAVTDSFVMMRNLNQLRTNDFHLGGPWELREFSHDLTTNTFKPEPLALTPDLKFDNSSELGSFIELHANAIDSVKFEYPDELKAASTAKNDPNFTWSIPGNAPESTKKFASLLTCIGCHNGDKIQVANSLIPNFLHIAPRDSLVEAQTSQFLDLVALGSRTEHFLKALQVDSLIIDSLMQEDISSSDLIELQSFIKRLPDSFRH